MCGIFGYIAAENAGPDIDLLKELAEITQTRGAHAFGLAWIDAAGSLGTFKRPGPASRHLQALEACKGARIVIGHCRYATHGDPSDNANNHPHPAGRGELVHNGVVHNHLELAARYRLRPQSDCDSEVLGLLLARGSRGTLAQRAAWLAAQVDGTLAMLGIWALPTPRLLVVRNGRPLHFGSTADGHYLASLAQGLPEPVEPIVDNTARLLEIGPEGLRLAGRPIALVQKNLIA